MTEPIELHLAVPIECSVHIVGGIPDGIHDIELVHRKPSSSLSHCSVPLGSWIARVRSGLSDRTTFSRRPGREQGVGSSVSIERRQNLGRQHRGGCLLWEALAVEHEVVDAEFDEWLHLLKQLLGGADEVLAGLEERAR